YGVILPTRWHGKGRLDEVSSGGKIKVAGATRLNVENVGQPIAIEISDNKIVRTPARRRQTADRGTTKILEVGKRGRHHVVATVGVKVSRNQRSSIEMEMIGTVRERAITFMIQERIAWVTRRHALEETVVEPVTVVVTGSIGIIACTSTV